MIRDDVAAVLRWAAQQAPHAVLLSDSGVDALADRWEAAHSGLLAPGGPVPFGDPSTAAAPARLAAQEPPQLPVAKSPAQAHGRDTAADAAHDNRPRRGSQRWRILEYLSAQTNAYGRASLTAEQLSDALHLPLNSTSTRCSELEAASMVEVAGHGKTSNGSRASTYRITDHGERVLRLPPNRNTRSIECAAAPTTRTA